LWQRGSFLKSLDGLWKDKKREVLVQLQATRMFVQEGAEMEVANQLLGYVPNMPNRMVESTLRVIRGHDIEDHIEDGMTLISVLPKYNMVIILMSMKRRFDHYRIKGLIAHDIYKNWVINVRGTFEKS